MHTGESLHEEIKHLISFVYVFRNHVAQSLENAFLQTKCLISVAQGLLWDSFLFLQIIPM